MINVKDFGAVGDGKKTKGSYTDDFHAFDDALKYLRNNPPFDEKDADPSSGLYQGAQKLFVPAGHYYLSDTLDISGISLIIEGESCGGPWGHGTVLRWPTLKTGIRIHSPEMKQGTPGVPDAGKGANSTILRNLSLVSDDLSLGGLPDQSSHGIHALGSFAAEDISVDGFAHSGIFINASLIVGASDPIKGGVNCFSLSRVVSKRNGVAGLWVQGNDANAGTVTHLSATGNGQYGIYDKSFLGNTYVGCHTAGNGSGNGGRGMYTQVSHNSRRYYVSNGMTDCAVKKKPDPKDATVWRLLSDGGEGEFPQWVFSSNPTDIYSEGSKVSNKGKRYKLIKGMSGLSSTEEPGQANNVWELVSDGGPEYPAWMPNVTYAKGDQVTHESNRYEVVDGQKASANKPDPHGASGWKLISRGDSDVDHPIWGDPSLWSDPSFKFLDSGAYISLNNTAENVFVGCYSEGGQPASYLNSPALVLGGVLGTDMYGDVPGIASVLAPTQDGLRVRPGIITESTDGTAKVETTVGCLGDGTFLKFFHSEAAPEEWRYKIRHNDLRLQYGRSESFVAYVVTGPDSSLKFGNRDPIHHALYTPNLVISGISEKNVPDTINARRVTCFPPQKGPDAAKPPAELMAGDWVEGDFCFNATPGSSGILGWSCTAPNATWKPVRIVDQMAAQDPSSATDLASLRDDFNKLLVKMRDAGMLAGH